MTDLRRSRSSLLALASAAALIVGACGAVAAPPSATLTAGPPMLRIGAVFPLGGMTAVPAAQERTGVQIAAALVNADGGVDGRRITLDVRDLESGVAAPSAVAGLRALGDVAIVGAYASDLSIGVSAAAAADGLVYWEAGAVADQLTGRGLPLVFRVGASGTNLGSNSAQFAATVLAPRLGKEVSALRVSVVAADDAYAQSVADAAVARSRALGMVLAADITYHLVLPDWASVLSALAASRPDVVILASHIPDGIAFRRAMLAAGLHVGALIGSTMAECGPDFGADLGAAAVGVFASDRPTGGFNPAALSADARAVYARFAAVWRQQVGGAPTEEGLSGFTAAWALFHAVLPAAARSGSLTSAAIAAAARAVDLPAGSLPNGAGLRFSTDPSRLGQNDRAAAVIWQWQAVRQSVVVWPPVFATGAVRLVPLPA